MECNICGEEIVDVAYCELSCSIVIQNPDNQEPLVFSSPTQRSYYNAKIIMHDKCWIKLVGTKSGLKLEDGLGIIPVSQ